LRHDSPARRPFDALCFLETRCSRALPNNHPVVEVKTPSTGDLTNSGEGVRLIHSDVHMRNGAYHRPPNGSPHQMNLALFLLLGWIIGSILYDLLNGGKDV
jgi:hypothetical protein